MSQIKITITNHLLSGHDVKVVTLAGSADSSNVEEANDVVSKIIDENQHAHLILEGGELAYVNSTFIGYLTDWFARLEEKECRILLASFRPNVIDTLTIVGLTHLIQHFPSVEEAKLALTLRSASPKVEQNYVIP